jgi:hypothetical protein
MVTFPFMIRNIALAAGLAFIWSGAAAADSTWSLNDAQARYNQDMADCKAGKSNQDLATCRLEARNALAAAPRGGLSDEPGQYQQNALRRCSVHTGDDRIDCEARIRNEGNVEGSIAGGGVLRQSVRVVPVN